MTLDPYFASHIAEVDKTLAMVREFWLAARDPQEKTKNRVRLDELLDQRFALMQKRDGVVKA